VEVKLPRTSGGLLWEFVTLSSWLQAAIIIAVVVAVALLVAIVVRRSRRKPAVRKPPVASGSR
jgi:heme/copper-type cytochrome/quinol oxidase subunit 2